jgi:hypothetical protein
MRFKELSKESVLEENAGALNQELAWFFRVLDTRIKLQFGHDCEYADIVEVPPPELASDGSMYGSFVHHYTLNFSERLIFLTALVPHVRPQLLDVFFTKNANSDREFTEFGGRNGHSFAGFLPTGNTGLYILAGDDLVRRFDYSYLFEADHIFARHNILSLENSRPGEPFLSGFIRLNPEIVDLVTTGNVRKPHFSFDFPAKLIETEMEWADLVLDPFTMEQVLEIKTWIRYGDLLLNDLGLKKKVKPGYRALFYGPSGTGKTLTASLLGKVTGRDVYRIDLSLVISKYIGETEKNLEKIFKQAENKDWILFFDEADALFGKRTKISDAHDRFANQEVSYLLQRVEDYAGVVILASNFRSNIDDAFMRRFQAIIHFPMPKPADRLRLWQDGFSTRTELDPQIDLRDFAETYEIAGGGIMNVIRYATLMALQKKTRTITHDDLLNGVRKEFAKEGKTF